MALNTPPVGTILADTDYPHRLYHSGETQIQYAHPSGDDSHDGLTWGTAKETILAAYDALPSSGGMIYIADQTYVGGEVSGQGIWLAGGDDVNYASLPAGWRQVKSVIFMGVPAGEFSDDRKQRAFIGPGTSGTTWTGPWIWLSAVQMNVQFHNLSSRGGSNSTAYGIDMTRESDGSDFTAAYNCVNIEFHNIGSKCSHANANAGYNPLRAFGCFWILGQDSVFAFSAVEITNTLNGAQAAAVQGASESWTMNTASPTDWPAAPFTMLLDGGERVRVTAKSGTSYTVTRGYDDTNSPAHSNGATARLDPKDPIRAAVYLGDSDGSAPNYLWELKDIVPFFGSIVTEGQYASSFENIALESCSGSAIYFIGAGHSNVVDVVDAYDMPSQYARGIVEISPASGKPSAVSVRGAGTGIGVYQPTFGPCTTLDGTTRINLTGAYPPLFTGVYGISNRRVLAQTDTPRRMTPSIAHHVNLASHNPTDWSFEDVTGVTDVFGLTNAGTDTNTNSLQIYSGAWSPSAPAAGEWLLRGDFVFFGIWAKVGNGIYNSETATGLKVALSGGTATFAAGPYVAATGDTTAPAGPANRGFNEWMWQQGFAKVAAGGASTLTMTLAGATVPITACYPVLFTASSMYDSEAWETFRHLASIPSTAPAGHWSAFRGQKVLAPGGIGVGNSASATTPGSVVRKMEVFSEAGVSLGFVPIYSTIT